MKTNAYETRYLAILVLSMIFLLVSCDSATPSINYNTATLKLVATPTPDLQSPEEESPSESGVSEAEQALQSFEQLRQTALNIVGEGSDFQTALQRFLINYSSDSILLTLPIRNPDLENDIYNIEKSGKRYHVLEVALCDYRLEGANLIEGGYTIVPILVKTKTETVQVQEVTIPELHNPDVRKRDIIDIFGVESEEELELFTSGCDHDTLEHIWSGYEKELCSLKCQIASEGGFSGFANGIIEIYNEIKDSVYFDNTTEEGAIRTYFLQSSFRYDMLCLPYWHELARETNNGETTLYLAMYIGDIYAMEDGTLMTGSGSTVGVIKLSSVDGRHHVTQYERFMGDGEVWLRKIEEYLGEYADDYHSFRETEEYDDMIFNGERLIDALVDGTFKPAEHEIN